MFDLGGGLIPQFYGCECDLGSPCHVPECEMRQGLEARGHQWMRKAAAMNPTNPYLAQGARHDR